MEYTTRGRRQQNTNDHCDTLHCNSAFHDRGHYSINRDGGEPTKDCSGATQFKSNPYASSTKDGSVGVGGLVGGGNLVSGECLLGDDGGADRLLCDCPREAPGTYQHVEIDMKA